MLAVFVLGMVGVAKAWSDDIFFFTSFENVSEWKEMYERCEKPQDPVRHHISPVAFPSMDELHKPPPHLGKRVMHLYTKSPRSATNYFVSYTFPKDNECLYHKAYAPCYISRQVGFIRARNNKLIYFNGVSCIMLFLVHPWFCVQNVLFMNCSCSANGVGIVERLARRVCS